MAETNATQRQKIEDTSSNNKQDFNKKIKWENEIIKKKEKENLEN